MVVEFLIIWWLNSRASNARERERVKERDRDTDRARQRFSVFLLMRPKYA